METHAGDEETRATRSCTPSQSIWRRQRECSRSAAAAAAALVAAPRQRSRRLVRRPRGREHQTSVYLATDSLPVVKESRAYAAHFDIVHLPQQEVGRHDPKMGQALLWDKRVWQRHFWGQTDWTQHMAWTATVEMLLLAHADLFIGKFTSNIFRAAYALRAAQCDCAPLFASLDAPMCFDYGVRSGRNCEFPLVNVSLGVRDRADATFQC